MNELRRVAIVTGAGGGIGSAVGARLNQMGYRLVLVGRQVMSLEKTAEAIRAAGGETLVVEADVSTSAEVEKMVQTVMKAWGRVDVLINNAGMVMSKKVAEMNDDEWRGVLGANLDSAFFCTRSVWRVMEEQFHKEGEGGVIVNISSRAAEDPFAGLGAYAVAKSGVNMLTLVTAREGEKVGIRVVGIGPGAVNTGMFRGLVGEKNVRAAEILAVEDVAAMVGEVVGGAMRHCSGETVYLHKGAR